MKFLQKATLAAAIAAASFAAQALQPIGDSELGGVTGQAGVTIEIDMDAAGITIGEVAYTDEGTVVLENIRVSETDITQTIDTLADGSLKIGMTTTNNLTIDIGNGVQAGTSAVALRSTKGSWSQQQYHVDSDGDFLNAAGEKTTNESEYVLTSATAPTGAVGASTAQVDTNSTWVADSNGTAYQTEVVNDVHAVIALERNDTTVVNMANPGAAAAYGITQSFDNGAGVTSNAADGSAVILADMDVRIVDLDVGAFGYTQAQANTRGTDSATAYAAGYAAATDKAAFAGANTFDADNDGDIEGAELTALQGAIAGGSAVKLKDVTFDDGAGGAVNVKQTIWAQGGTAASGGGVYIAMGNINGTLEVGGIELGGASIGSVSVSNIQLNGLTQRIYGH
ncbi:DUF6160 family protein [Bacterioplanoides sp.]|uniref:DUF6160 family protein n=1 Tax=Bacterioplanoides sp. TaxID=2066072 RepID=UPI003B5AA6FD